MTAEGKKDVRRERIRAGQCPNCGKEAAPYYLCHDCRSKGKLVRILNRAERAGGVTTERRGRDKYYSFGSKEGWDSIKWRPDPKEGDGRLAPRLRGVRVDVEATLIEVIVRIGRPCTLEEILAAWGKLRDRRTTPLASDLSAIIRAEDKRKRRAAKLASVLDRQKTAPADNRTT